jgi:integral membrane sensor domain MASE1
MAETLRAQAARQQSAAGHLTGRWASGIALAAAVGLAYFLVAEVAALGLVLQPASISVFWPSAGISSGALIALGPRWRWPAVAGIAIAQICVGLTAPQAFWHVPWVIAAITLCDTAEPLIVAGLIARYFGPDFALDRLRNVVGLMVAAVIGAVPASLGAAVTLRLALGPPVSLLTTAQHWFASVLVGTIAVAPLVIGVAGALRQPPPPRSEWIEVSVALAALALVIALTILLPRGAWEILLPVAWSLPIVLWLAARSHLRHRPFRRSELLGCRSCSQRANGHLVRGDQRLHPCRALCRTEGDRSAPRPVERHVAARARQQAAERGGDHGRHRS